MGWLTGITDPFAAITTPAYGGAVDWNAFYGATLGPVAANARQSENAAKSDSPFWEGSKGFGSLLEMFGVDTGTSESPFITLPDGTKVKATGDRSSDLLTRIFGTSPLGGDQEGVGGETVSAGTGGLSILEGIEGTFARIAIIILGFIFVAVGLSMFKGSGITVLAK